MIFPKGCGAITVLAEHFSQGRYTVGTNTSIAGKGSSQLHDSSCIIYMVVTTCKQCRARRGAKGSRVKTIITQTTCSQLIERRHVDGSAKSARGGKTDIVKQNDHHIGRFCRRLHFETRWCFCIPGI